MLVVHAVPNGNVVTHAKLEIDDFLPGLTEREGGMEGVEVDVFSNRRTLSIICIQALKLL